MSAPAVAAAAAALPPQQPSSQLTAAQTQALQDALSLSSLSEEQFEQQFAGILRVFQKDGECRSDWTAVRHLLALRLQSVYADFVARDAASQPNPMESMCFECRQVASERAGVDGSAAVNNVAAKCRHSAVEEEPRDVRFQRIMHALVDFYKPPFTFQRICDLLLEPRLYSKNVNKFLAAFSKLVLGISSEVLEDNFNVNWLEQKDQTLGIPQMQFATREEDEFGAVAGLAAAGASSPIPGAAAASGASGGVGSLEALVATHALLPPQHHRLGMSAADIAMAQAQEAAAKQALLQQQQQQQQQFVSEGQTNLPVAAATEGEGAAPNQGGGQAQQADGGAPMDSSE